MQTRRLLALLAAFALASVTGCSSMQNSSACCGEPSNINQLVAVLTPTAGNNVRGVVRFTNVDGGVRVVADVEGLQPNSTHAFHIHEFGDATKPDATSAGSHYNPESHPHGRPDDAHRHAGDLGNITADANGHAHYERVDHQFSLVGPNNPILGRAVIIHAGTDKFTQPVGDAGGRIAIGIIGIANPGQTH